MSFDYSKYCNDKLFATFPELRDNHEYKKIIRDALDRGETSAHGIYEDVFCPYVLDLIKKGDKESKEKAHKAFSLVEEIINHPNFEVTCIAYVGFIEKFTAEMKPMKDVEKYLSPKSLEAAREIAQKWFGRNPLTWEEE